MRVTRGMQDLLRIYGCFPPLKVEDDEVEDEGARGKDEEKEEKKGRGRVDHDHCNEDGDDDDDAVMVSTDAPGTLTSIHGSPVLPVGCFLAVTEGPRRSPRRVSCQPGRVWMDRT